MENNKKDLQKEFDSICLKDHLNASFDNDNISVSEDLIARTLKAIKAQEELINRDPNTVTQEKINPNIIDSTNEDTQSDNNSKVYEFEQGRKKKPFPVRRLVSAAAILAVLLIGINVIQDASLPFDGYNKNATGNSDENVGYNTEANDSASINSTLMMEAESEPIDGNEELNALTESALVEDTIVSMENATEDTTQSDIMAKSDTDLVGDNPKENYFSALYLARGGSILSTALIYNNQEKVTTDTNQINELIKIIDKYTLELNEINSTETWNYEINLEMEDEFITMYLGENLKIVDQINGDFAEYYYNVNNIETLVKEIDDIYRKMSK